MIVGLFQFQLCADWRSLPCYVPDRPVDLVAILLALVAIAFAIKQYYDARRAEELTLGLRRHVTDLKGEVKILQDNAGLLNTELRQLKENSSTHALPTFPENVPAVCKLLDECTRGTTLLIMADYIGYSLYSAHDHFDAYLISLGSAVGRGVKVRLLVYGYGRAKNAIRKQFPDISAERGKPRFEEFFKWLEKPLATSEKEFYRALLLAEEKLYPKLSGIEMRLLLEDPPALFWMKDNPYNIVFGFRDEFPGTGFSFESEDHYLCEQFGKMFKTHWDRAEEHWDCRW